MVAAAAAVPALTRGTWPGPSDRCAARPLVAARAPAAEARAPAAARRRCATTSDRGPARAPRRVLLGARAAPGAACAGLPVGTVGGLPVVRLRSRCWSSSLAPRCSSRSPCSCWAPDVGGGQGSSPSMARWRRPISRARFRRVSVSVAALAVSLAMIVAIAVMISSFRETVIYWVGQTLKADLYVATARRSNLESQSTISASLEQIVSADPDVAAVDRFRSLSLPYHDRLIVVGAGDFRVLLAHGHADVQGARRRPEGHAGRYRARRRPGLRELRAEVRSPGREQHHAADTRRAARVPRGCRLLRLLDRPRRGGDGSRHVRPVLRRPPADQPHRLPASRARRRAGPRPAARPARFRAPRLHPHQRLAPGRGAARSSTRPSPSPTAWRESPLSSRCSG